VALDELAVSADDPRLLGVRRLLGVMDRLRGPGGCPWDHEQDAASLRPFLLEETYELLEALDAEDAEAIHEELGDVLFQVVFHARLAEEQGPKHLGTIAAGIAAKLHRRPPHVFEPDGALQDRDAIAAAWIEHKRQEGRRSVLDGVPRALPALLRAQRVQEKAARVGFDWPDAAGPWDKLHEELGELREELDRPEGARDPARIRHELGDLLFSAVNLARHLGVQCEDALRETTQRFERRFRRVEAEGGDLRALDLEALEALWRRAKAAEGDD
jgi:MazG family protein